MANVEVIRTVFSLLIGLSLVSCEQKKENSFYRIVGKNGKAIYIEKKVPKLNEEYLARKKAGKKNNGQLQAGVDSKKYGKGEGVTNGKMPVNPEIPSSAYSLRSVMDGTISYDSNLESSAEDLDRVKNSKTIVDFDYLPHNYFSDDRSITESRNRISTNSGANTSPAITKIPPKSPKSETNGVLHYVQLGLFLDRNNAEKLIDKFTPLVPNLRIVEGKMQKGKDSYKVVGGGFASKTDLEKTVKQIENNGHTDIYTFRE
ncbi:MAG: SPOR domain-containing protein [Rickettsiales bacterium]|nr:SPOR domain-containing protein [Rickettsiales bacterium]